MRRRPFLPTPVLLLALAACAGGGGATPPTFPAATVRASVPGFDTRDYPGGDVMRTWRESSPYRWVGYYLEAPCRPNSTWSGRRGELERLGWGMAVLYLGEQDWSAVQNPPPGSGASDGPPRCTAANLTAEKGAADGRGAAASAAAEGFPQGTAIYLDVERVDSVSAPLRAYVRAWVAGVLEDGRYVPALYAHERNASALHALVTEAAGAAGSSAAPRLWVASADGFELDRAPWESGFAGATVWQGRFNARETWGGATLNIDANVASTHSP